MPATSADKIAVLPLEVGPGIKAGRSALEAAVVKGLVQAPSPVLAGPEVTSTLTKAGARVACSDAGCWKAAGRALGARHLVTGAIDKRGPNFEVEFRLVDAVQGRVLLTEVNQCNSSDCSVAELCRLTVNELARAGLVHSASPIAATPATDPPRAGAAPPPAAEPPAPTPPPTSDPLAAGAPPPDLDRASVPPGGSTPGPTDLVVTESAPSGARRWPTWLPIASIATGVVAGGVGGFLIYKDGDGVATGRCYEDHCPELYRTFWGGVATAGAGAVLVGTGIVMAILDAGRRSPSEGTARVLISPTGVAFAGRF